MKPNFRYKDLMAMGFERFDHTCQVHIDNLGFSDFYLFLKSGNDITFEWRHDEPSFVKMIRYKKENVLNYAKIEDIDSLKNLISFFSNNNGNKEDKISLKATTSKNFQHYNFA